MRQLLFCLGILLTLTSKDSLVLYPYRVGFIPEEEALDAHANFIICDESIVLDYYNVGGINDQPAMYVGGTKAIAKLIRKEYPELDLKNESGMLTIRFMINCKGETGRFQFVENDLNYQPKSFEKGVKQQMLDITKSLSAWKPNFVQGKNRDTVMYLTYKIKYGEIIAILP